MDEGQDEMIAGSDHAEGFIRDTLRTENPSTDDEIDIKYEGTGFEYNSTSNAEGYHDNDPDPNSLFPNVNPKSGTQCPINSEQIEMSEFCLRLLQCEQDCETCQKYIRELSEHISATHAECQPPRDPLLIGPLDTDKSSAVKIKCEVDEDIERMDYSEESDSNVDSVVENSSLSEPDYNASHDLNPQRKSGRNVEEELESDPDYNVERGNESDPEYITPGEVRSTENSRKETFTTDKESQTGKMPSKIRFKCTVCEKSFSQKGHLDRHMRIHTGEKPYKCKECGKTFTRKDYLTAHVRGHKDRPFKCELCLNSFTTKIDLTNHVNSHRGENPKCGECGKIFSKKCNLDVHMRSHTGEKPFKCAECAKSYSHKCSLDNHMRCHTGERPFKCTECEKSFSRKDVFDYHMRSHIRRKAFQM